MATIIVDLDSSKKEIYLTGDITALVNNRFAWRYVKDYLHPIIEEDRIIIPFGEEEAVTRLEKVNSLLIKYGFSEKQSDDAEQVLADFFQEEQNFINFSKKALQIRNNHCDSAEFSEFTTSVSQHLSERSLYPLQLLSAYHLAFSQNACNFSVPGAGKTSIVYGAYAYLKNLPIENEKHVDCLLVIGPLSSFGPWEQEYEDCFGKKPTSQRLVGGVSKEEKQRYLRSSYISELTLISYDSTRSLLDELGFFLRNNRVMVVLDEAHKIKNASGGVTAEAVLGLARFCKARVVLTGTPAPNGYEDMYNMFKFIWPTKNVIGFNLNQLRDITDKGDKARVERLIENISPFFIRIKKSDLGIPDPVVHPPIGVEMGEHQRKIYDFVEHKYVEEMIKDGDTHSSDFKALLNQARLIRLIQAASNPAMLQMPLQDYIDEAEGLEGVLEINDEDVLKSISDYDKYEIPSKYVAAKSIIEKILAEKGKVIVWATFIYTIDSFADYLKANGIACEKLYGAVPVETGYEEDNSESDVITREKIIREFHKDTCPYSVIIANPFAVAESISLHKVCHNAIYLERSFNAAHFVQSKDRIHRYGLPSDTITNYYYLLSNQSIDETIDSRLKLKENRMIEIMESMPIPLFDNIKEDEGDDDIKALIDDYVKRTKKY